MQAATRAVAVSLARRVRTLPTSGSIAALARKNSTMQAEKDSSPRLVSSARIPARPEGGGASAGGASRNTPGSMSWARMRARAMIVGTTRAAVR